MTSHTLKRIFVLVHFPDDSEQMCGPFSSIEEAVDQQSSYGKGMDRENEYSYCGELFWTVHAGCWFDRTEEFIEEWCRRDETGPRIRKPSQRKFTLAAAE